MLILTACGGTVTAEPRVLVEQPPGQVVDPVLDAGSDTVDDAGDPMIDAGDPVVDAGDWGIGDAGCSWSNLSGCDCPIDAGQVAALCGLDAGCHANCIAWDVQCIDDGGTGIPGLSCFDEWLDSFSAVSCWSKCSTGQ